MEWPAPATEHQMFIMSFPLALRQLALSQDIRREITMKYARVLAAATLLVGASLGSAGQAQQTNFSGSGTATALVSPNAGCAPLPFQGIATGSGSSNLGNFTYNHSACTSGATGAVQGTYTIDFGADRFAGSLLGTSTASSTAGLFDLAFNYAILSGTGRFANSTGAFTGLGTVDVRGGPPSRLSLTFSAVPEPRTWALMLLSFGIIGAKLHRAKRTEPLPQAA